MAKETISKTSSKSRYFALVSYRTDTEELIKILQSKQNTSVRAYALIKHDKDENDSHHHIVIRTHSTWTCSQIAKWFMDDSEQNTFCQIVRDRTGIVDYLTHENEKDKYHYDKGDIIDGGLSDILPIGESSDDSYEIINKMLDGTPTRELARLYGKDFIYHINHYIAVINSIRQQEGDL